jgi:hypothetical protein
MFDEVLDNIFFLTISINSSFTYYWFNTIEDVIEPY